MRSLAAVREWVEAARRETEFVADDEPYANEVVKIYLVGGAVRDELLGLPVKERDYVVVGATPEEMVRLGFKPVGKDFPVFLHPKTHEEYALARTERKSGRGYKGFTVYASPGGHARRRPQAPRPHDQRHGEGRGRHADRSLWRQEGPRGEACCAT